jgi:hypothetical protein
MRWFKFAFLLFLSLSLFYANRRDRWLPRGVLPLSWFSNPLPPGLARGKVQVRGSQGDTGGTRRKQSENDTET